MGLINLKRVSDREVREWLLDVIPDLSKSQKQSIWCYDNDIIRLCDFEFMKRNERVDNIFIRMSVLFLLPVFIILVVGLPVNFLFTGNWGYSSKIMGWYSKWTGACGF